MKWDVGFGPVASQTRREEDLRRHLAVDTRGMGRIELRAYRRRLRTVRFFAVMGRKAVRGIAENDFLAECVLDTTAVLTVEQAIEKRRLAMVRAVEDFVRVNPDAWVWLVGRLNRHVRDGVGTVPTMTSLLKAAPPAVAAKVRSVKPLWAFLLRR